MATKTSPQDHQSWIAAGEEAIAYAQRVRAYHRRRTSKSSPQRRTDVEVALDRLARAMRPIRSEQGRFMFLNPTEQRRRQQERLFNVSHRIAAERRKLLKLIK